MKFCKDCVFYFSNGDSFKTCLNEKVNEHNSYYLVDRNPKSATNCKEERRGGFFGTFYKPCGPSGKLFQKKEG